MSDWLKRDKFVEQFQKQFNAAMTAFTEGCDHSKISGVYKTGKDSAAAKDMEDALDALPTTFNKADLEALKKALSKLLQFYQRAKQAIHHQDYKGAASRALPEEKFVALEKALSNLVADAVKAARLSWSPGLSSPAGESRAESPTTTRAVTPPPVPAKMR
jgi:hypothetical protein